MKETSFPFHGYQSSSGLAFDGTYLWTIYHQPVGIDKCDNYVQYTTDGSVASIFRVHPYPVYIASNAVSWDGEFLWTDEKPGVVKVGKYNTAGSLLGTFSMPAPWGTDAGYYHKQLWHAGLWPGAYVYGSRIGRTVVASFAAPGGSCWAVGFDGEYLWTADRNTPQYIYKVDIDVVDVAPASVGRVKALYR